MRNAEFGIGAARHQRTDLVANLPALLRARPMGHDFSGDLQTQYLRSAGRRRVIPLALEQVRPVNPGGSHSNEHFSFAGLGPLSFPDP